MSEGDPAPRDRDAMLSDWYWALDTKFGLTECRAQPGYSALPWPRKPMGLAPWDWPGVLINSDSFRALKEALLHHQPLDGNEITMRDHRGRLRHISVWGKATLEAHGKFSGYKGIGREVTQLRRSQTLLALEYAVARSLCGASTSREILQAVMREVCEAEHWEVCGFFRVEDELATTRLIAGWAGPGMVQQAANYYRQTSVQLIPPGGMLSRVAQSGKPLWVRALRQSQTTWADRALNTGERATLFCPALADAHVLGVFAFASRQAREPDEPLLRTMRVIGEQTGQFLKRKQFEQALLESEERFRAMTELSADWYWETDADLVLTRVEGQHDGELGFSSCNEAVGSRIPGAELIERDQPGKASADGASAGRWRFRDLQAIYVRADGAQRHISICGQSVFDQHGTHVGYRGVGRDVTAMQKAEESRLATARLLAEHRSLLEASRLKSMFLKSMSHELHTPLNGVLGFAHLLRRSSVQNDVPKLLGYVEKIEASGQKLLRLIDQLLDYSRLEAGKFEFLPQSVSVRKLVQEVLQAAGGDAKRKEINVQIEADPDVDEVTLDPTRLRQVVWTYVCNAVAFTPHRGRIVVRTLADGQDRFRIEVEDSGVGIEAVEIPRLFSAFHQVDSSLSRNHEGAGMSLALARALIEGQGGTVGISSVLGVGSTFHLVLPREVRPIT